MVGSVHGNNSDILALEIRCDLGMKDPSLGLSPQRKLGRYLSWGYSSMISSVAIASQSIPAC
jgi:hypothetical protein